VTAEPDDRPPDDALPDHLLRLAAELGTVVPFDDIPAPVLANAHAAWTWRLIDAELAELAEQDRAVLRAGPDALMTFAAGEVYIDVDRVPDGSGRASLMIGQVTASAAIDAVEVELAAESPRVIPADLDADGGFRVTLPEEVPVRLAVRLADGRRVVSSWVGPSRPPGQPTS